MNESVFSDTISQRTDFFIYFLGLLHDDMTETSLIDAYLVTVWRGMPVMCEVSTKVSIL
jgi:hypothetical protein